MKVHQGDQSRQTNPAFPDISSRHHTMEERCMTVNVEGGAVGTGISNRKYKAHCGQDGNMEGDADCDTV